VTPLTTIHLEGLASMSVPHRPDQPDPAGPAAQPAYSGTHPQAPPPAPPQPRLNWNEWPPPAPAPRRPGTVTAAAVLLFVTAGLGILGGIGMGVAVNVIGASGEDLALLTGIAVYLLLTAALSLVVGIFILKGRQWARITAIVLNAVGIATGLIDLILTLTDGAAGGGGGCAGLGLNVAVIALLGTEGARGYFRAMR
jgi:hypothetical protein